MISRLCREKIHWPALLLMLITLTACPAQAPTSNQAIVPIEGSPPRSAEPAGSDNKGSRQAGVADGPGRPEHNTSADNTAFAAAVARLQAPETWCDGARALSAQRDPEALIPLLIAYETPVEVSKSCLLDAMATFDVKAGAMSLVGQSESEVRRRGFHLMELFANEAFLPALERGVGDPNPMICAQALSALASQHQTMAWETVMIRLLDAENVLVRGSVIESLRHRGTPTAKAALRARLNRENDPSLREKLETLR